MPAVRNLAKIAAASLGLGIAFFCQTSQISTAQNDKAPQAIPIPDLGFRYTPPPGMEEVTTAADRERRNHEASHSTKTVDLLLDMRSSPTDMLPDWRQVWILAYPRALLANLSDPAAEEKMNNASAGPRGSAVGQPQTVTIAGRNFTVSQYEDKQPPLLKHARIYTTICRTQLVSFIFVSNCADQVTRIEESLKSLSFSPAK